MHEDTQQIDKGGPDHKEHKEAGRKATEILASDPMLKVLHLNERKAFNVITGLTHLEIAINCKRLTNRRVVDIAHCMHKAEGHVWDR